MSEKLQIVIVSAGLAALINCVFQLINKLIDNAKERRENEDKKLAVYIEKKERVYIAAIGRLLQIRDGFGYTREMIFNNEKMRAKIDKENDIFSQIAPQLRIYSTDKIFNKYQELARYACFAYAPQNGARLLKNGEWAYDMQITLLARMMQEDIGYRKYNSALDMIVCPECGCEHDFISKCPQCKLSYEQLQKKASEILIQMQENEKSDETTDYQ